MNEIRWGITAAAQRSRHFQWRGPIAHAESAAPASIAGPIAVTAQSGEPYRGANEQPVAGPGLPIPALTPYGYVEEEYFVSGIVDGKPYKTSLLVRKPKDPAKFSGLVAVETIHAAGAIPLWGFRDVWLPVDTAGLLLLRNAPRSKRMSRKSNPSRYTTLQIPESVPAPGTQAIEPHVRRRAGPDIASDHDSGWRAAEKQ